MDGMQETRPRKAPVDFTGETGDYFKIWIVNTALTIVTLGIYSAWAKVRKLRYFYTHTSVEGGHFDYHAKPIGILIGRLIAVGILGLYFYGSYISPYAPLAIIVLVVLLVPWLVVRSRIFNLRNTSLNGLRFNFRPNYWGAIKAYYGGALFAVLTLGFGTPSAICWRNRFAVENSAYGQMPFEFGGRVGEFYSVIWKSIGLALLGIVAYFVLTMGISIATGGMVLDPNDPAQGPPLWFSIVTTLPLLLVYFVVGVYVQVRLRNYVWNSSSLGENRFHSTLAVVDMTKIYLTNLVGIALSLGLLIPWAQIRLARYRAEQTELLLADDWQKFIASNRVAGSALGDEIGEAFDVDVDFAF